MSPDGGHRESFADGVAAGAEARAACSQARSGGRLAASRTGAGDRERSGLGGLWLLLVPLACCGGPLLIAALAAAGALAWARSAWGPGCWRRSRSWSSAAAAAAAGPAASPARQAWPSRPRRRLPGGHQRDEHHERNAAAVAACTRVSPPPLCATDGEEPP